MLSIYKDILDIYNTGKFMHNLLQLKIRILSFWDWNSARLKCSPMLVCFISEWPVLKNENPSGTKASSVETFWCLQ